LGELRVVQRLSGDWVNGKFQINVSCAIAADPDFASAIIEPLISQRASSLAVAQSGFGAG
jgi:hypothetical protein